MKFYKDQSNLIRAFESDGSQDGLINPSWVEISAEEVNAIKLAGVTDDQKVSEFRRLVGRHIDDAAKAQGFDSIITAVSYADEPSDEVNQGKGLALRAWRSACWAKCREDLSFWVAGGDEPTKTAIVDGLPLLKT